MDGVLPDGCDRVCTIRRTPRHLSQELRDGIAGLDEAPLADRLAAGRLDPLPSGTYDYPPGFLAAQQIAYRACTEPCLHAVWGPPGTGACPSGYREGVRASQRLDADGTAVMA